MDQRARSYQQYRIARYAFTNIDLAEPSRVEYT